MQDIKTVCHQAEQGGNYPMSEIAIEKAHELYAAAVGVCQERGFPLSSIRVEMSSWGRPATSQYRVAHQQIATLLSFNGKEWVAERVHHWSGGIGAVCTGSAFVLLETRPAPEFKPKKLGDTYRAVIATWGDRSIFASVMATPPAIQVFPWLGNIVRKIVRVGREVEEIASSWTSRKMMRIKNESLVLSVIVSNSRQKIHLTGTLLKPGDTYIVPKSNILDEFFATVVAANGHRPHHRGDNVAFLIVETIS